MSLEKSIQNGIAVTGVKRSLKRNADGVFTGRMKPYFADTQNMVAALYGQYADNCYDARLQGYDPEDFYAWWPVKLRLMDVAREASGTNLSDDIKSMVVFYPQGVDYVPMGAMAEFAGNQWLVTNPANMNSILSETIIRRCNAVYKRLDWYGNVLSCPFNRPKMDPRGAQDDYTKNMILADHYFTAYMQLNEVSAAIHENTRMILGDAAYSVRGLNNFSQEFTGDENSVHILYFQLQREEKVGVYDDMDRKIADGLAFSWDISLEANVSMHDGQTHTIIPTSVRNGERVAPTAEHPFSYVWASSDTSVLEVSDDGDVTAVGEGTAYITCTLAENREIGESVKIDVSADAGNYVSFSGALASSITEQQSAVFEAAYYEDGEATDEPVEFSFSGPESWCYSVEPDGNSVLVRCWERSDAPLVITARYGAHEAVHSVRLEAW